ncbi:PAS domain-containing protein [Zavarzinia compransoris]|uniref:PAS domain-containing protein n=1 Tax=Zavarzinia compransoris TaxID=1264899 RepID=A0A317E3I0_9PROT|nr:PAS domain-containing protein [Zavarzinia compransoris]PWR20706.1 hypothetical protein DKG75_11965 [Zavarzinia compransoris]TDP44467.1 hypothetical protein DES42_107235 [Zavarzinia compransoris]
MAPLPPTPEELARLDRRREALATALSGIVRHVHDGIAIIDDAGRIASINDHLAACAGLDAAAVAGRPADSLLGWTAEEARTTRLLATGIPLITEAGRQPCEAVILPVERDDGRYTRIVILHVSASPKAPVILNDFERRVLTALRPGGGRVATGGVSGQIEVVMVEAVKQRLGPRWRFLSEKVMTIASTMIGQRLRQGESYARIADTSFVIAFGNANLEEAAARARAIATDILQHLLGDAETANSFMVKGSAEPLPEAPANPPPAGLEARIATSRAGYESRLAMAIDEFLRNGRVALRPAMRRGGAPSGLMLVDLDGPSREAQGALRRAGVFPRTHPETGLLPLALGIEQVYRALDGAEATPLFLVPVPWPLLDEKPGMEQFLALARPLPPAARRQLILTITELPKDTPRQRLTDIALRLAPFCRRVGIALEGIDDSMIAYEDYRPTAVLLRWTPDLAAALQREPDRLRKLVARAHQHHCLVLVQGQTAPEDRALLDDAPAVDLVID